MNLDIDLNMDFKIDLDIGFDLKDNHEETKAEKFIREQTGRVKEFEKIGLPERGSQIMMVSDESFNSLTFLLYIMKDVEYIDELVLSFYSFSMKALKFVEDLVDQGIVKKFIFQTSYLRKYGTSVALPQKISSMIEKFGKDRVSGSFINSHAKIMLCNIGDKYYVVEGSGNLPLKVKMEQYLVEDNKESYDFHKNWITTSYRREEIK